MTANTTLNLAVITPTTPVEDDKQHGYGVVNGTMVEGSEKREQEKV